MKRIHRPSQAEPRDETPMEELLVEVIQLFHRLRAAAEEIHQQGVSSGARRGVLRNLVRQGPLTVPQLARMRPVSRQHMQSIVNALEADGLVTFEDNPAHRRSKLASVTAKGRQVYGKMEALQRTLLNDLPVGSTPAERETALFVVKDLQRALADPAWRRRMPKPARKQGSKASP